MTWEANAGCSVPTDLGTRFRLLVTTLPPAEFIFIGVSDGPEEESEADLTGLKVFKNDLFLNMYGYGVYSVGIRKNMMIPLLDTVNVAWDALGAQLYQNVWMCFLKK